MERYKGFLGDPFDTKVEIVENGVRYFVDVKDGQKTGFFLDQKYNRQAIWQLCRGARGAGLLHPYGLLRPQRRYLPGRSHVIGVDASELGRGPGQGERGPQRAGGPGGISLRGCV